MWQVDSYGTPLSNQLSVLSITEVHAEIWDTIKYETLQTEKESTGELRSGSGFASMLYIISFILQKLWKVCNFLYLIVGNTKQQLYC